MSFDLVREGEFDKSRSILRNPIVRHRKLRNEKWQPVRLKGLRVGE